MAPPLHALSPDQDHETLFRFQSDLASVESNATHQNAITCSLSGQPVANCWLAAFGLTLICNSSSHWSVSAVFQDLIQNVAFLDSFSVKLTIFLSFPWWFGVWPRNLTESLYLWVLEGDIKLLISFCGSVKKVISSPLMLYPLLYACRRLFLSVPHLTLLTNSSVLAFCMQLNHYFQALPVLLIPSPQKES